MTARSATPDERGALTADELGSEALRAAEEAGLWRDQAGVFGARTAAVLESLARGWRGGQSGEVMGRIDVVNEEVVGCYRRAAADLDEQADGMRLEARRCRDRADDLQRSDPGGAGMCGLVV